MPSEMKPRGLPSKSTGKAGTERPEKMLLGLGVCCKSSQQGKAKWVDACTGWYLDDQVTFVMYRCGYMEATNSPKGNWCPEVLIGPSGAGVVTT